MIRNAIVLTLLAAVTFTFAACASTGPSALSGKAPVYNDKGRLVGYQAR
jgi:hypothetical protein